jgi:hypothetical protein
VPKKGKSRPRKLVSPVSLLNDFAVAINERNIFKDLKGDKKLLNLMRAKA